MIAAFVTLIFSWFGLLFGQDTAEIVFAGDAMQHQGQIDAAKSCADSSSGSKGNYSYSGCFDEIASQVLEADYAVVNLETPVGYKRFSGYPCFNSPASFAEALKDAGFDLFLTANNHTLDRHSSGLKTTCDILDSLGVDHIGTYKSAALRSGAIPFVKTIKNIKFGFLNYTYGTNGIEPNDKVIVDYIDRDKIKADIKATREAGAEILIVAVHWGDEYKLLPNAHQKNLAEFLIKEGVDVIIGGHPHVIQPFEMRQGPDGKKILLVYSLGNFISNMKTRDTRGGAIMKVLFTRDLTGKAIISDAGYELVFTLPPSGPNENFKLLPIEKAKVHPRVASPAKAFEKSAEDIFKAYNKSVKRLTVNDFYIK